MDINTLRKMRQNSQKDFGKIAQEFEKIANPSQGYKDNRFWKPEVDKAGNASATIRFLNKVDGDDLPWVKVFSHAFQGPTGKWYIENSLTTIGEQDFIGEENSRLYNSGNEADKKIAQARKRKLNYICNILVVSDPKHPENEGKVFLFKFGKKIFDKIMDKAQPSFVEDTPVNVFDYWNGADFKLRQKKVDGFPNYDASTFAEPSAVTENDEELLAIVNAQHKLSEFLDRKNFKSYDELKTKFLAVVNGGQAPKASEMGEEPPLPSREAPRAPSRAPASQRSDPSPEGDDDSLDYFKSLAED
jgi:hypothetical protein